MSTFSHIATAGLGTSALGSRDWSSFVPPYRGWDRSIEWMEAQADRRIDAAVRAARDTGELAALPATWLAFLRMHLQVGAFLSKAVARALEHATQRCPWPSVGSCVHLASLTHERQAVSIVLLASDLEGATGCSPIEDARTRWHHDAAWQGAREVLADLEASEDWAETLLVTHLCVEPLVGVLLRHEFGTSAATAYADRVTPVIADAAQAEYDWACDWTAALVQFLLADDEHGPRNRRVIGGWLADWSPRVQAATACVADLAAGLDPPRSRESLMSSVCAEQRRVIAATGLA